MPRLNRERRDTALKDTSELAQDLWTARVSGAALDREGLDEPKNLKTAYAIQDAQQSLSEKRLIGWKLGATSAPAQEMLHLDGPFWGPIYQGEVYQSGMDVPIFPAQTPLLETEFAVTLAQDLPTRRVTYTRDDIHNAIDEVNAAFEIVAARVQGGLVGAGLIAIADGGGNAGIVLGDLIPRPYWQDTSETEISLEINGHEAARGTTQILAWEHIFDGVRWLLDQLGKSGRGLKTGDVIMTGTCTGVTPIKPGETAKAQFGDIGAVHANFT